MKKQPMKIKRITTFLIIIIEFVITVHGQDSIKSVFPQSMILKTPYMLSNYNYRWKNTILFSLENEFSFKRNYSMVISMGYMPEVKRGLHMVQDQYVLPLIISKGWAFDINLGGRLYYFDNKKTDGLYSGIMLGQIFTYNTTTTDEKYNLNFFGTYLQTGYQKSIGNFYFDLQFIFGSRYKYKYKSVSNFNYAQFIWQINLGFGYCLFKRHSL